MRQVMDTLREARGESLVETIVSFLVIAVALLAFAGFAIAGSNLNAATTSQDADTGERMTRLQTGSTGSVTVDGTSVGTITIYGNDGGVYSYKKSDDESSQSAN